MDFERWPGIATRYAKKPSSFAAAIEIRIIAIWLKILRLYHLAEIKFSAITILGAPLVFVA